MVRNLISAVAMLALTAGALFYMGTVGLSVTDNVNVRTASMTIPNTNGLTTGSRVLLRGVAIGKVTDVTAELNGVRVQWNYKKDYAIPSNAVFRVDNLSALGETYLGILAAPNGHEAAPLPDGAVLAATQLTVPTTIDEFSARFTNFVKQVNSGDVQTIAKELNTGLLADQQILTSFAHAGALLESTVLSTRGQLTQLLGIFQEILRKGSAMSDAIAAAGEPAEEMTRSLINFIDYADKPNGFVQTLTMVRGNLDRNVDPPPMLTEGVGPFLQNLIAFLTKASPDIKVLADAALPPVTATAAQLKTADLSQLTKMALDAAGSGHGLVVHVGTPKGGG